MKANDDWFVVIDEKEAEEKYTLIRENSLVFSPDSKQLAYVAKGANIVKWFVVVGVKKHKEYDFIAEGGLLFSPDSKHIVYKAMEGTKWCVVVDDIEGKPYDGILAYTLGEKSIVFDSVTSFYYLARKENAIYLVEERLK